MFRNGHSQGGTCLSAKIIHLFLIITFFTTSLPPSVASAQPATNIKTVNSNIYSQLAIPQRVGKVVESHFPTNGTQDNKVIIYIQDAHCNFEAQKNIENLVKTLVSEFNVKFIGVEGATGEVDFSWFKEIGSNEKRVEIADEYIEKGLLTGTESLAITSELDLDVFGVEDPEIYLRNFDVFRDVVISRRKTSKMVNRFKKFFLKLKEPVYRGKLKEFDEKFEAYNDGDFKRKDYLLYLASVINQVSEYRSQFKEKYDSSFESYKAITVTAKRESKLSFKQLDAEQRFLVSAFNKDKIAQKKYENITSQYQDGILSKESYYGGILELAKQQEIKESSYKGLKEYFDILVEFNKIPTQKLLSDVRTLTYEVMLALANSPEEKKLVFYDRCLKVLKRLFDLKLTRDQRLFFIANKAQFDFNQFIKGPKALAQQLNIRFPKGLTRGAYNFNLAASSAGKYYEYLLKRDKVMVENLLAEMDNRNQDVGVLIAGGFHSEGIAQEFVESKTPFIILSPRVGQPTDLYYDVMLDKSLDIEGALASFDSGLARVLLFDRGIGLSSSLILRDMVAKLDSNVSIELDAVTVARDTFKLSSMTYDEKSRLMAQVKDIISKNEQLSETANKFLLELFELVQNETTSTVSVSTKLKAIKRQGNASQEFEFHKSMIDHYISRQDWANANEFYNKALSVRERTGDVRMVLDYPELMVKRLEWQEQEQGEHQVRVEANKVNVINREGHFHFLFQWKGKTIDINVPGDGSCFCHAVAWGDKLKSLTIPESVRTLSQMETWLREQVSSSKNSIDAEVTQIRSKISTELEKQKYKDRIINAIASEIGSIKSENLRQNAGRTPENFTYLNGRMGGSNNYSRTFKTFFDRFKDEDAVKNSDVGFNAAKLKELLVQDQQFLDTWVEQYIAAFKNTSMWAGPLEEEALSETRVADQSKEELNVYYQFYGMNNLGAIEYRIDDLASFTRRRRSGSDVSTSFETISSKDTVQKLSDVTLDYTELLVAKSKLKQPGRELLKQKTQILQEAEEHRQLVEGLEKRKYTETELEQALAKVKQEGGDAEASLEEIFNARYGILNKNVLFFKQLLENDGKRAAVRAFIRDTSQVHRVDNLVDAYYQNVFKSLADMPVDSFTSDGYVQDGMQRKFLETLLTKLQLDNSQTVLQKLQELSTSEVQTLMLKFQIATGDAKLSSEEGLAKLEQDKINAVLAKLDLKKGAAEFNFDKATILNQVKASLTDLDTSEKSFKSLITIEALKDQQFKFSQKQSGIQVSDDQEQIKLQKLTLLKQQEQALINLILPSKSSLIANDLNKPLNEKALALRNRVRQHNVLKWTLSEDFRETMQAQETHRLKILGGIYDELVRKKLIEEDSPRPIDFSQISKLIKTSEKGEEIRTAIQAYLTESSDSLKELIRSKKTRKEADEVLTSNPDREGLALALANAGLSIGLGYPSLTSQQLMATLGAFRGGKVLELATGEGKTEVSAAVGYLNGLSGLGSLIITTKNNSAIDTFERTKVAFDLLGMSFGVAKKNEGGVGSDAIAEQNREAYGMDVTVVSTTQFHFDAQDDLLLRVNKSQKPNFKRSLDGYAMVIDEFDSVMIHQAQTEYIRSSSSDLGQEKFSNKAFNETFDKYFSSIVETDSLSVDSAKQFLTQEQMNLLKEGKLSQKQVQYILTYTLIQQLNLMNPRSSKIKEGITKSESGSWEISPGILDQLIESIYKDNKLDDIESKFGQYNSARKRRNENAKIKNEIEAMLDIFGGEETLISFMTGQMNAVEQYQKSIHYDIADNGDVQLIDYGTGAFQAGVRLTGRPKGGGGHIAIELIEKVNIGSDSKTTASLSARDVLLSIGKSSGVTGTARQTSKGAVELYGMGYQHVPTQNPLLRNDIGLRGNELTGNPSRVLPVFRNTKSRAKYLAESLVEDLSSGRPVLIFANSNLDSYAMRQQVKDELPGVLRKKIGSESSLQDANRTSEKQLRKMIQSLGLLGERVLNKEEVDKSVEITLAVKNILKTANVVKFNVEDLGTVDLNEQDILLAGQKLAKKFNEETDLTENERKLLSVLDISVNIEVYNSVIGENKSEENRVVDGVAGQPGSITIVTNIGGRGTDFKLHGQSSLLGYKTYGIGATEGADIEAQRRGRSGRQGAMGSTQELISLDTDMELILKGLRIGALDGDQRSQELLTILLKVDLRSEDALSAEEQRTFWEAVQVAQTQITKSKETQISSQVDLAEFKFNEQLKFKEFKQKLFLQLKEFLRTRQPTKFIEGKIDGIVKEAIGSKSLLTQTDQKNIENKLEEAFGFKIEVDISSPSKIKENIAKKVTLYLSQMHWEEVANDAQAEWFSKLYAMRFESDLSAEQLAKQLNQSGVNQLQQELFKTVKSKLDGDPNLTSFVKNYMEQVRRDNEKKEQEDVVNVLKNGISQLTAIEEMDVDSVNPSILKRKFIALKKSLSQAKSELSELKEKNLEENQQRISQLEDQIKTIEGTDTVDGLLAKLTAKHPDLNTIEVREFSGGSGSAVIATATRDNQRMRKVENIIQEVNEDLVQRTETLAVESDKSVEQIKLSDFASREINDILDKFDSQEELAQGINRERLKSALQRAFAKDHVMKIYDNLHSPEQLQEFLSMDEYDRTALLWVMLEHKVSTKNAQSKSSIDQFMALARTLAGPKSTEVEKMYNSLASLKGSQTLEESIVDKFQKKIITKSGFLNRNVTVTVDEEDRNRFGGGRAGYLLSILKNGQPSNEHKLAMAMGMYNDTHQSDTETIRVVSELSHSELKEFMANKEVRSQLEKHNLLDVVIGIRRKKAVEEAQRRVKEDNTRDFVQEFVNLESPKNTSGLYKVDTTKSLADQIKAYEDQIAVIEQATMELKKHYYSTSKTSLPRLEKILSDLAAQKRRMSVIKGELQSDSLGEQQQQEKIAALKLFFDQQNKDLTFVRNRLFAARYMGNVKTSKAKFLLDNDLLRDMNSFDQNVAQFTEENIQKLVTDQMLTALMRREISGKKLGVRYFSLEQFNGLFDILLKSDSNESIRLVAEDEQSAFRQYLNRYSRGGWKATRWGGGGAVFGLTNNDAKHLLQKINAQFAKNEDLDEKQNVMLRKMLEFESNLTQESGRWGLFKRKDRVIGGDASAQKFRGFLKSMEDPQVALVVWAFHNKKISKDEMNSWFSKGYFTGENLGRDARDEANFKFFNEKVYGPMETLLRGSYLKSRKFKSIFQYGNAPTRYHQRLLGIRNSGPLTIRRSRQYLDVITEMSNEPRELALLRADTDLLKEIKKQITGKDWDTASDNNHWINIKMILGLPKDDADAIRWLRTTPGLSKKILKSSDIDQLLKQDNKLIGISSIEDHVLSSRFFSGKLLAEQRKFIPQETNFWRFAFETQQASEAHVQKVLETQIDILKQEKGRELTQLEIEELRTELKTDFQKNAAENFLSEYRNQLTTALLGKDRKINSLRNYEPIKRLLEGEEISFQEYILKSKGKSLGIPSRFATDKAVIINTIRSSNNPKQLLKDFSNFSELEDFQKQRDLLIQKNQLGQVANFEEKLAEINQKIKSFKLVLNSETAGVLEKTMTRNARIEVESAIYQQFANVIKNDRNVRAEFKQIFNYDELQMDFFVGRLLATSQIKVERLMEDSRALSSVNNRAQLREVALLNLVAQMRIGEEAFRNYDPKNPNSETANLLRTQLESINQARQALEYAQVRYREKMAQWKMLITLGITLLITVVGTVVNALAFGALSPFFVALFFSGMALLQQALIFTANQILGNLDQTWQELAITAVFAVVAAVAAQFIGAAFSNLFMGIQGVTQISDLALQYSMTASAIRVVSSLIIQYGLMAYFLPNSVVQDNISKATSIDPRTFFDPSKLSNETKEKLAQFLKTFKRTQKVAESEFFNARRSDLRNSLKIEIEKLTATEKGEQEEFEKSDQLKLMEEMYQGFEEDISLEDYRVLLTRLNLKSTEKFSLEAKMTELDSFLSSSDRYGDVAQNFLKAERNLQWIRSFNRDISGGKKITFVVEIANALARMEDLDLDQGQKLLLETLVSSFKTDIDKIIQEKTGERTSSTNSDTGNTGKRRNSVIVQFEELMGLMRLMQQNQITAESFESRLLQLSESAEESRPRSNSLGDRHLHRQKTALTRKNAVRKRRALSLDSIQKRKTLSGLDLNLGGTLRPTGYHNSKAYIEQLEKMKSKHDNFEDLAGSNSNVLQKFSTETKIVIEADFGDEFDIPAYNFPAKGGGHIIVLNTNKKLATRLGQTTMDAIQLEVIDHETVEVEWMIKLNADKEDSDRTHRWSHIISSAHQIIKHGDFTTDTIGLTPFHELDLKNKNPSELASIIKEYESGRLEQLEAMKWANQNGATIDLVKVASYEKAFYQFAKKVLFAKINNAELQDDLSNRDETRDSNLFFKSLAIVDSLGKSYDSSQRNELALKVYASLDQQSANVSSYGSVLKSIASEELDIETLETVTTAIDQANLTLNATQRNGFIADLYSEMNSLGRNDLSVQKISTLKGIFQKLGVSKSETQAIIEAFQEILSNAKISDEWTLPSELEAFLGYLGNRILELTYQSGQDKEAAARVLADAIFTKLNLGNGVRATTIKAILKDGQPIKQFLKIEQFSPKTQQTLETLEKQKVLVGKIQELRTSESAGELVLNPKTKLVKKENGDLFLSLQQESGILEISVNDIKSKFGRSFKEVVSLLGLMKADEATSNLGRDLRWSFNSMFDSAEFKSGNRKTLIHVSEDMSDDEIRQVVSFAKRTFKVDSTTRNHHKLIGDMDAFVLRANALGLLDVGFSQTNLESMFIVSQNLSTFKDNKPLLVIGQTGIKGDYNNLPKAVFIDSSSSLQASMVGLQSFVMKDKTPLTNLQKNLSTKSSEIEALANLVEGNAIDALQKTKEIVMPPLKPLLESILSQLSDEEETILIAG